MSKSPSLRRIQADIRELALDPSDRYYASPLEHDMFEWHFTIRGAEDTDFDGGIYHGRILLPPEYPFKPPHIMFLTPSGRFETNTKVCLSFSAFHPELWQPAWGIRLILEALIAFLPSPADGAIGSLNWTPKERKRLAIKSQSYCCPTCGPIKDLLPELIPDDEKKKSSKKKSNFSKEIEELQRLQQLTEGAKNKEPKNDGENEGGDCAEGDGKTEEVNDDGTAKTSPTENQETPMAKAATSADESKSPKVATETPTKSAVVDDGGGNKDAPTLVPEEMTNADNKKDGTTTSSAATTIETAEKKTPQKSTSLLPKVDGTLSTTSKPPDSDCDTEKKPSANVVGQEQTPPPMNNEAVADNTRAANVNNGATDTANNNNTTLKDPWWMVDSVLNALIVMFIVIIALLSMRLHTLYWQLQDLYEMEAALLPEAQEELKQSLNYQQA